MYWEIIFLVILLSLSAFFSGIEIALVSITTVKVRTLLRLEKKGAKILEKLKENPKRMIITVLIGNNIVNVAASAFSAVVLTDALGNAGIGIATGAMTLLILTFGEILPKTYFAKYADKLALRYAHFIYGLQLLLFPFVIIFEHLSKLVAPDGTIAVTENEIKAMIEMGGEEDILHKKQTQLMKSVFEFDDTPVREIMTPRVDLFRLPEDTKIKDAIKKIKVCGHSRVLTYRENIDKVTGYFHIRDLLGVKPSIMLKTIALPAIFVSSEKIIQELFIEMQKSRYHMAVVVDEFGGTAGIVTMEDILEELVGEIMDENDEQELYIKKLDAKNYLVSGDVAIDDINETAGIKLREGSHYTTIGGYIQYKLKDLPKKGETVALKSLKIKVVKMSNNKVDIVRITKQ